ncbi:hypothetical protein I7I53_10983 [Histoplasma capsulatum var. duboisii H88]|uniref:Uncharacterized protein n=1 Tax=Ajellomyces capsulatus (strain H88) TaxID=544711 RepID=A0A8A1LCD8_AJEC8|nr:hypothetical protein I7I53_10983 [Histoplasma capsulatum var. duboisii H88]
MIGKSTEEEGERGGGHGHIAISRLARDSWVRCAIAPPSLWELFILFQIQKIERRRTTPSKPASSTHPLFHHVRSANEEENTLRGHRNSSFSASHQKLNRPIKYDEVSGDKELGFFFFF